ncbi:hypothetical protein B0H34DRAFT_709150 [Crassisporium funariophilum]|nr:hypothetical protein B0H34DRAFT_709150 [Crassisporium funariophilum]
MSSTSISQLTPLLPSPPLVLAYSLPLLLLSLILTFAGTFLTLDRSRSFPAQGGPDYAALPVPGAFSSPNKKVRKLTWALEGGVGGLVAGYAFGLHLSTALALLIPATTNSASLSPKSFLAVWLLSCVVTTPLAGRYRYAAFAFISVSGGALISLALCVIIHPSLPSRIIFIATFTPLLTILTALALLIPRLSTHLLHPLLRFCTASTGAFGLVLAVSLLLNPKAESWANVWERLWLKDGQGWGTGKEQALSAAFGVFLAVGLASDWALKRWIGDCPDEKWDSYLANYASNLPNHADRAGTFQPLTSFWDKIFPSGPTTPTRPPPYKSKSKDILFPSEAKLQLPGSMVTMHNIPFSPSAKGGKLSKSTKSISPVLTSRVPTATTDVLKKANSKRIVEKWRQQSGARTKRKPVKFGADSDGGLTTDSDDLDSEEDDDVTPKKKPAPMRPWGLAAQPPSRSYSSSTPTLVDGRLGRKHDDGVVPQTLDYDAEIAQLKKQRGSKDERDYSDYEEDLTAQRVRGVDGDEEGRKGWSPKFLQRHQSAQAQGQTPMMPVPATPSLIKALDRIAVAQRDVYGQPIANQVPLHELESGDAERRQSSPKQERAPRWEEFWREVKVKAQA